METEEVKRKLEGRDNTPPTRNVLRENRKVKRGSEDVEHN